MNGSHRIVIFLVLALKALKLDIPGLGAGVLRTYRGLFKRVNISQVGYFGSFRDSYI